MIFAPNYDREFFVGFDAIRQYLFTGLDGRFMQSIKAFLPSATFTGTVIKNRHYSIVELVAIFLRRAREAAEQQLGRKLEGRIVLGRPARFSLDPEEDRLAESRLLEAAQLSGLPEVTLLIEPIAAALAYEARLDHDEVVIVADLGGGTSDFTVMRVGPGRRRGGDRNESVLASGGLPVAGDALDGEVVRARLFDQLGYGSEYRAFGAKTVGTELDLSQAPALEPRQLSEVEEVSRVPARGAEDQRSTGGDQPPDRDRRLRPLLCLVPRSGARQARRTRREQAEIADDQHGLPLKQDLTPEQFAGAIAGQIEAIRKTAFEVLERAKLDVGQVDAVFLTGGTSLVSAIRSDFARIFGAEKLRGRGTFTSVVDGLARASL